MATKTKTKPSTPVTPTLPICENYQVIEVRPNKPNYLVTQDELLEFEELKLKYKEMEKRLDVLRDKMLETLEFDRTNRINSFEPGKVMLEVTEKEVGRPSWKALYLRDMGKEATELVEKSTPKKKEYVLQVVPTP